MVKKRNYVKKYEKNVTIDHTTEIRFVALVMINEKDNAPKINKFTICLVDNQNKPCADILMNYKLFAGDDEKNFQSLNKTLDKNGKAYFEFTEKSVDMEIEVKGNYFRHVFKNGDEVTFKLFTDDDLNLFPGIS